MNIHPINSTKNIISGHTTRFADILIKYNNIEEVVNADDNGLFEYNIPSSINDNTKIELTSNVGGGFIYQTRTVATPFEGELTLLSANPSIDFSSNPIDSTYIFPKVEDLKIKIVDSRLNSSDWKLYTYINKQQTSTNGFVLNGSLIFKTFDDEIIVLNNTPTIVYKGNNNEGIVSFNEITLSKEKDPLLNLTDNAMEVNEEYFATIYFYVEE